jgi:uncharacterized protein
MSKSPGTLSAYAAVFDTPTRIGGDRGFVEIINKSAFTESLKRRDPVVFLFNHDDNAILGRTSSGTLNLKETAKGLHYTASLPDTSLGRDVATLIERRDLAGNSFAMYAIRDKWTFSGGEEVRNIIEARLVDVSVVVHPAYPSATIEGLSDRATPLPMTVQTRLMMMKLKNL